MSDVKKEYEKNSQLKKEDVDSLRSWAEKQPHLPKITELQYILFLQSCYYSNEQAKSAIENFFTIRTLCRDIFANGNPKDPAIQMALDVSLVTILPQVALTGYKVVFMKLLDCNPDRYILGDQLRMFDMIIMLCMHLQGTNEGLHIVFDFEGSSFAHLLKYTSLTAKKFMFYVQEALPIRLKDIHVLHAPSWIDKALAIIKPLIKSELFDMINIHTTMDTFYKKVPQEMLPKDFGGNIEPCKVLAEQMRTLLENNAEFFKNLDSQTTDESKRVEKSTDFNKIFGLEGTFKKLEVD